MITVKDLKFTYPGAPKQALTGLTFEINEGEIFGFLGPSGAGKSTTLNILIGLLKDYSGNVQIMGKEISDWNQDYYEEIGVSFELPNHYLKMTAMENLNHFRGLYTSQTNDPLEVLDWVGLKDDAEKRVSEFSKGMKVRLNIARSIIHNPNILFLDEPTTGLDPVNARKIKDLVLRLRKEGTTVFVTTHNMMVADELCDRVAFITAGDISVIDAPDTLKKQFGKRSVRVEFQNGAGIGSHEFPLDDLGINNEFISLLNSGNQIETIHTQETTLENIFIEVTGQELSV